MAIEKLKERFAKFTRRHSHSSSSRSQKSHAASTFGGRSTIDEREEDDGVGLGLQQQQQQPQRKHDEELDTGRADSAKLELSGITTVDDHDQHLDNHHNHDHDHDIHLTLTTATTTPLERDFDTSKNDSLSTDFPTPNTDVTSAIREEDESVIESPSPGRPQELQRRQSLLPAQQTRLIKTLLSTEVPHPQEHDYFSQGPATISANMVSRKIWVKRPGASATLVTINEDDLVDDVRDMILRKYANSLGRSFDAPDVTLRIIPRENTRQERTLGPEEPMGRTLDAYFPGGQTVEEALVIDVPLRRTPKPSPRPNGAGYYDHEERRPHETGSDYFPPMPAAAPSPRLSNAQLANGHSALASHSMSVLTTGHVPNLPSPGGSARRHHPRPRMGRQHTSSPTVLSNQVQNQSHVSLPSQSGTHNHVPLSRPRTHSTVSEAPAPPAPPIPTPPLQPSEHLPPVITPARTSSPRPNPRKKTKKPSLPTSMLNSAVPPINVLIVEDNFINLKLLEAFMKRLKVRWETAVDGQQAVDAWRTGGFHLVLMDIQLPIMSGLEATKEIRRLENVNSIGVFNEKGGREKAGGEVKEEDRLTSKALFKSPVIIVALTASSLQSDRHEALAAGCNDFLTKPVNFVWLERKVMEWGCMQALIDYDGWRKWKDFSQSTAPAEGKKLASAKKKKANRGSLGSATGSSSRVNVAIQEE